MQVEIIFMDARGPKTYNLVVAPYEKGSFTCFTLEERNPKTGNHIIMDHRTETIFSIGRDHMPHVGTTLAREALDG